MCCMSRKTETKVCYSFLFGFGIPIHLGVLFMYSR